jgi:hypothetical protein
MSASAARRWRKATMSDLIPVATKVLLSGVLVLLAIVFLGQAWRMWFNRSLVLAPFDFLEAGKPSVESGEQFARMVRADLVQLAGLYNSGEVANAAAVPSSNQGEPAVAMKIPEEFDTSFFETIEFKAYGIEFGTIFTSLRRQLESPSEITGSVTHQGEKYSVFAELKQPGAGAEALQRWSIQYARDLAEARCSRVLPSVHGQPGHVSLYGAFRFDIFLLFVEDEPCELVHIRKGHHFAVE